MNLDLLPYAQQLRTRESAKGRELWCAIRKTWLAAQPEEFVRQALISYFLERRFPAGLMQVERKVGTTRDRLDLLILDLTGKPFILAEVKAPGHDLQPAIQQLARYNRHWRAPYALAVNGLQAIFCSLDFEKEILKEEFVIPDFPVDKCD